MGPDGYYTVDEPGIWKKIKAIQDLKTENNRLAQQLKSLKAEVNSLKRAR